MNTKRIAGLTAGGLLTWHTSVFEGVEDMQQLLNCLPQEQAVSAKLVPLIFSHGGEVEEYISVTYLDRGVWTVGECVALGQEGFPIGMEQLWSLSEPPSLRTTCPATLWPLASLWCQSLR